LGNGRIITLSAVTGSKSAVLSGHTECVSSLVFSSNGKLLVSGSIDNTIRLWEIQTGWMIKIFNGHTGYISSVSICADGTMIASASRDKTIKLWNIQTGGCNCSIKLQHGVDHVTFSPIDSGQLFSISGSKVQQWRISNHKPGPVYNASYIAFSPDHTQLALCSGDAVIVQSLDSGANIAKFYLPDCPYFVHCCFSPDGRLVAAASVQTAYVWDITNSDPHLVGKFDGHTFLINSIVFSSPNTLISVSIDNSVKFWKIDTPVTTSSGCLLAPDSITFVNLQAREKIAISGGPNGVVMIWDILTGTHKVSFQTPARESFHGDAQLINDRLLFVWSRGEGIHIWDSKKAEVYQTLSVDKCYNIRISDDGSKVFDRNVWKLRAWSTSTWDLVSEVELGIDGKYGLSPLHANGSKIWFQYKDLPVKGWDFGTSDSFPIQLSKKSFEEHQLNFVGDINWTIGPFFVEDRATGKIVFRLSGKYKEPHCARWDGQYLVVGYPFREVLIFDFNNLLYK
jgi:WD40 repeat protein